MPLRPTDDRAPEGTPDEGMRELEATWEQWVRGNSPTDAKTSSLLRAAFAAGYEAGYEVGRQNASRGPTRD